LASNSDKELGDKDKKIEKMLFTADEEEEFREKLDELKGPNSYELISIIKIHWENIEKDILSKISGWEGLPQRHFPYRVKENLQKFLEVTEENF